MMMMIISPRSINCFSFLQIFYWVKRSLGIGKHPLWSADDFENPLKKTGSLSVNEFINFFIKVDQLKNKEYLFTLEK